MFIHFGGDIELVQFEHSGRRLAILSMHLRLLAIAAVNNIFMLGWVLVLSGALYISPSLSAITNPACQGKRYLCDSLNADDSCVRINDPLLKVHYVNKCPSGYYCDYQRSYDALDNMTFKCRPQTVIQLPPGEPCTQNLQCMTGVCSNGFCIGKQLNQMCQADTGCSVGLFCNRTTRKCHKQKAYLSNCDSDNSCINSCVCNLGVCNYYYSLTQGTPANNSKSCSKGYVESGVCTLPPRSSHELSLCSSDSDCQVISSTGGIVSGKSKCECGYNGGGYSYCSLVEGDQPYQQMITQFAYVLMSNQNCHTTIREGPCHLLFKQQYTQYAKFKLQFLKGPQLVYNDICTKFAINDWYWGLHAMRIQMVIIFMLLILM